MDFTIMLIRWTIGLLGHHGADGAGRSVHGCRPAHLLIKFVPLEALERFRGAGRYASAIDDSLTHFGAMLQEPASIAELLLDPVPS